MKKSLILLLLIITSAAFAGSNRKCIDAYRDSFHTIYEIANDFNNNRYGYYEDFASDVVANDTKLRAKRLLCTFTESDGAKKCVKQYKSIYYKVRNKIDLKDIATGNQEVILLSETASEVRASYDDADEPDGFIDTTVRVWNMIRGGVSETAQRAGILLELEKIDANCGH